MDPLTTLNGNVILTGPVDSYCLVCELVLQSEDECLAHINDPVHLQNVHSAPILDKYKGDNIVKVKLGYYCVYCNIFLKTVTKVGLHVNDFDHKQCKIRSVRWEKSIMLAFEEIQIQEYAFHGIIENTCLICNTDEITGRLETHIENNDHVLELIKNNKYLLGDNFIYRMLDGSGFFCIICAKVYNGSEVSDHNISDDHKNNYNKGKELALESFSGSESSKTVKDDENVKVDDDIKVTEKVKGKGPEKVTAQTKDTDKTKSDNGQIDTKFKMEHKIENLPKTAIQSKPLNFEEKLENKSDQLINEIGQKETTNATENIITSKPYVETEVATKSVEPKPVGKKKKKEYVKPEIDDKTKMLNENEKYIKNDIHINFETETVYCERCDEDLEFNHKRLEDHLKDCHDQSFKDQELDPEITQFAYENYMRISEGKAYCKLCEEDVSTNLEDMKDHVNFYIHIDIVTGKTGFGPLTKTTAKDFFKTLVGVESSLTSEVVVNNSLVVTVKSFHTIVGSNREMSCSMCQKDLKLTKGDMFMQHIATAEHKELLDSCNVVTSVQNELMRELRPGVYHCGYCNVTFQSWFLSVAHISCNGHTATRRHALWALERSRHVTRHARATQVASIGHATVA